ncbi:type II secretion system protein [Candidatus Kaiserbacteria bacterium]|nr:MAG: type II secretion system protein [Candidatus Kaiserbacteria bacterium]
MAKTHVHKRGFTLIETLVAISVLVVAVTGPLTLASQSLFAAVYAKDQTTAFYLAQEAIEMVRNKRDNNLLAFLGGTDVDWLLNIPVDTSFQVDIPNDTIVACGTECLSTKLKHDGIFYNTQLGESTRFGRSVSVIKDPTLEDEAVVTVVVQWQTGAFQERTISVQERIYNWVPNGNEASGTTPVPPPQCSDGIDNDGDGAIDLADVGCTDANDIQEFNVDLGDGGTTVICTELYRQGLLDDVIYEADAAFGATLSQTTLRGYHAWAVPVVTLMQKSEQVTRIVAVIAKPWTVEMAHQMGVLDEGSIIGKAMMIVGVPVSWTIGAVVTITSALVEAISQSISDISK